MLQVENLDLYYGDAQALTGVTLEVPDGEIVAIVGANGAGKTSLIRTVAGIERARAGRVVFKGQDITRLPSHVICNLGMGQVAEGRQIFPTLSVTDNLDLGAALPRARARTRRTLDEVYAMFPVLATRAQQLAGTLSGGEQQMVAIARGLMAAPRLVLLDEPSLGLSPKVTEEVFGRIQDIRKRGVTVLIVEQNVVDALSIADRGYVVENGRVVMQGDAKDLLRDEKIRAAYLGL